MIIPIYEKVHCKPSWRCALHRHLTKFLLSTSLMSTSLWNIVNYMFLNIDGSQTTSPIDTKPLETLCIITTQRFIKFFNVDNHPKTIPETSQLVGQHPKIKLVFKLLFSIDTIRASTWAITMSTWSSIVSKKP